MIKKILARVLSEILYYLGDWVSKPMYWFNWAWLYPLYNNLMGWSIQVQDWAGNDNPWAKADEEHN